MVHLFQTLELRRLTPRFTQLAKRVRNIRSLTRRGGPVGDDVSALACLGDGLALLQLGLDGLDDPGDVGAGTLDLSEQLAAGADRQGDDAADGFLAGWEFTE